MNETIVRLPLRIRAGLKAKLAELAAKEHRSLNRQIEFLLEKAIEEYSDGTDAHRQSGRSRPK
jgi:hypothetical protein